MEAKWETVDHGPRVREFYALSSTWTTNNHLVSMLRECSKPELVAVVLHYFRLLKERKRLSFALLALHSRTMPDKLGRHINVKD
ncbi:unnamed protein product [Dovyalis caffra]|uniref:Uncharacterized protein n=1 Tax=Dovyalis caffra TaxID=77055 RepID=A0AAV1R6K8_9ROSI|nr:unnamed protein product [Dovyalis caffra]